MRNLIVPGIMGAWLARRQSTQTGHSKTDGLFSFTAATACITMRHRVLWKASIRETHHAQLLVIVGIIGLAGAAALGTGCNKGSSSTPAAGAPPTGSQPAAANLPTSAEVKGIGVCCGKCAQNVKEALGKVDGIGDVTCDVEKQLVTYKAKDGKAAVAGWDALRKAGFAGDFKQDDKDTGFTVTGTR